MRGAVSLSPNLMPRSLACACKACWSTWCGISARWVYECKFLFWILWCVRTVRMWKLLNGLSRVRIGSVHLGTLRCCRLEIQLASVLFQNRIYQFLSAWIFVESFLCLNLCLCLLVFFQHCLPFVFFQFCCRWGCTLWTALWIWRTPRSQQWQERACCAKGRSSDTSSNCDQRSKRW